MSISRIKRASLLASACLFACLSASPVAGAQLELLSRSLMEAPATDACFYGETLLLCSGSGFYIFPNYMDLERKISVPLIDEALELKRVEGKVFVSIKEKGIVEIDISNPVEPRMSQFLKYGRINRFDATEHRLAVSDITGGIRLYARAKKGEFEPLSSYSLNSNIVDLEIRNDTLLALTNSRINIFRISKDNKIRMVSNYRLPFRIKEGKVCGEILFMLTHDGKLAVSKLSEIAQGKAYLSTEGKYKDLVNFSLNGKEGVLLRREGKLVPFELKLIGKGEKEKIAVSYGKEFKVLIMDSSKGKGGLFKKKEKKLWRRVVLEDSKLAVLSPVAGISIYEKKKDSFVSVSSKEIRGFAIDLIASGGYLYLANGADGVRIGKVSKNGNIKWVGHFPSSEARDVALYGKTLILADGRDGIKTVDVSDPEHPVLMDKESSPFFQSAVVSRNGKAFVAGGLGGVEVYDVRDPSKIRLLWRRKFSEVRGIHVDERFLYFSDGESGFRIFAIKNDELTEVSRFDTPGWNCDCFVIDDMAYLADGFKGIKVLDIKDRKNPMELGGASLGYLTREIHAMDKTVFAAAHVGGIFAVDVSDPEHPEIAAHFDTADDARGVFADERFVYLASGSGGVYIFRYKN